MNEEQMDRAMDLVSLVTTLDHKVDEQQDAAERMDALMHFSGTKHCADTAEELAMAAQAAWSVRAHLMAALTHAKRALKEAKEKAI